MNNKEHLHFITIAQVLSMILIVLSHSVPDGVIVPHWMEAGVPYMQKIGLVIFMISSGFLVTYTDQLEKYGIAGFFKRRTIRLMIPYVAVSLLMLLPKYFLRIYSSNTVSLDIRQIGYQLLTPRNGILPHLWFLFVLWTLCLLVPCLVRLMKKCFLKIVVAVILLMLMFMPSATEFLALRDLQLYAFWFYMGLLLGSLECSILHKYNHDTKVGQLCKNVSKYNFAIYILSLPIQNIVNIVLNSMGANVVIIYLLEFALGIIAPVVVAEIVVRIDTVLGKKCFSYLIGS